MKLTKKQRRIRIKNRIRKIVSAEPIIANKMEDGPTSGITLILFSWACKISLAQEFMIMPVSAESFSHAWFL